MAWAFLSWSVFLAFLAGIWLIHRHDRLLPRLPADPPAAEDPVCLLMPARDEAREIGGAVRSWLGQDLPGFRMVVVDDGSTDGTTEILAELRAAHPERLAVIRNDVLPEGWLGKNHAMQLAQGHPWAQEARWLLLADADVVAGPALLRRAVAFAVESAADILALLPAQDVGSLGERMAMPLLGSAFLILVPPHKVADPRSKAFCGIGAFTLARREAYDAVGGHAAAPLEAVDDMMLARRMKGAGFRNRFALGAPELHLRMYHGLWSIVRAMRKNAAALPFWYLAPLGMAFTALLAGAPLWMPFAGHPVLAFLLWLLVPPLAGDVLQRQTKRPLDPAWALWPLLVFPLLFGQMWAFADRVRGVNHWRGRSVKLDRTDSPRRHEGTKNFNRE